MSLIHASEDTTESHNFTTKLLSNTNISPQPFSAILETLVRNSRGKTYKKALQVSINMERANNDVCAIQARENEEAQKPPPTELTDCVQKFKAAVSYVEKTDPDEQVRMSLSDAVS